MRLLQLSLIEKRDLRALLRERSALGWKDPYQRDSNTAKIYAIAMISNSCLGMYEYDSRFYDYISEGAISSAREVLPIIQNLSPIRSVVDFGCGQGAWC